MFGVKCRPAFRRAVELWPAPGFGSGLEWCFAMTTSAFALLTLIGRQRIDSGESFSHIENGAALVQMVDQNSRLGFIGRCNGCAIE